MKKKKSEGEEDIFRFSHERERKMMHIQRRIYRRYFSDRAMSTSRSIGFCQFLLIIGAQLCVPVSTRGRRYMSGVSHAAMRSPHVTTVRRSHSDRISRASRARHAHNWPVFLVYVSGSHRLKKIVNFPAFNSPPKLQNINFK